MTLGPSFDMARGVTSGSFSLEDGWLTVTNFATNCSQIDYYGVTFDHLVPADDPDPEVFQINIIEMDGDEGEYANKYLPFRVDWREFTGKRILAVPRCCQLRKGTTDRLRINDGVKRREDYAKEQEAFDAKISLEPLYHT